jgi:hypothetical protein
MGAGVDIFRIILIGFIVKRFAFMKDPRLGTAIYLVPLSGDELQTGKYSRRLV